MRRLRATTLRRTIGLVVLAILTSGTPAAAQRFFPDDPLEREPAPLPAIDPGPRNLSFLLEAVSATFNRPGERHPRPGVVASQGVNSMGDVLDGDWYVNRHGRTRLSLDELQRGSGDAAAPSPSGPWRVLLLRSQNARPGIVFRDSNNRMYLLRFDPADAPEMATGAEMIASRFFHALGYHVPETYLAAFTRDRLVVESNASDVTSFGDLRRLLPEDIDRVLAPVARRPDGSYRAVAIRVPTDGTLVGPFQLFGTRSDDPNDIVPHEHRRDLRGLYVFASWLNHTRFDALHTMDIVVTPPGEPSHVRHYLFDFMSALGSGVTQAKPAWEGREPVYGQRHTIRNVAGLGLYSPAWMRAKYPGLPAVGRFESATFEADSWTPNYDVAPFANRLPDDTFWAARQVMAFTDDDIRAIVRVAHYTDPNAERWIADSLIERRNRIGRAYLGRVLPLDDFAVRDGELVFTDLAVRHGFADERRHLVEWRHFDNPADKPGSLIRSEGALVPPAATAGPAGSYVRARVVAEGDNPLMSVDVFLRIESTGPRVVGVDRGWPGRTLVDPRVVERPTRNRYAELEPERQKLFDTYAQALNAKSAESVSSADRFRTLSPSEQTTFDGVTHALLRSTLTDDRGRSLGRALDLVTGLERIAGQQAGRSGDLQFRLYVTLRAGARDTLEQSREFVRGHENTVYHAGYPHSYRLETVPSVQISFSEDALRADVDVDYRTSKLPTSLFNGHLTSSNSDVRAGDNARQHARRWNGFVDWWSDLFRPVKFAGTAETSTGPFGTAPSRAPIALPADRPINAPIAEFADAVQEFLTDWLVRRNFREAQAFMAPPVLACVADSLGMAPGASPDRLRQASLQLLERAANEWGRPRNLTEAMNPVVPWSPAVHVIAHAFEGDFTLVDAPTELGAQYECGATPPKTFRPTAAPQYGTYFGALLQVVREGHPGGTIVLVWRRVDAEWRLVAYRAIE